MRFLKLWLDGYGRFADHRIDLTSGLQVILGPNEQGKTTIRCFIGDMLYGQKRSTHHRLYDESHELRRPWSDVETYGGRVTYVLDSGREIEVQRNFDKKRESIKIFDRTHGRDITGAFDRLRNREPNFAEDHLGLSKAVFLNTATIGHMTLENLGDEDALTQIRERVLALADSSSEAGSADMALKNLSDRIGRIGRPVAHSKRPLPAARARLRELEEEHRQALTRRDELLNLEKRRLSVAEERDQLLERRTLLEDDLRTIERVERSERLEEAEGLKARIDRATQQCFSLGSAREFPLEASSDVQRAANAVATARAQVERTRGEQEEVHRQLQEEMERMGPGSSQEIAEISEETEAELARLEGAIVRLQERLESLEQDRDRSEERFVQAQRDLEVLPDFSRMGEDPVEWITQLAASFRVVQQTRAAEREKLQQLRDSVTRLDRAVAEPAALFSKFGDFPAQARDYAVQTGVFEEQWAHLTLRLQQLQELAQERHEQSPSVRWLVMLMAVSLVVFVGTAIWKDNPWVFIPALFTGVALIYVLVVWAYARLAARRTERELLVMQDEIHNVEDALAERRHTMDTIVRDAGYASLRELEALYDQFLQDRSELKSTEAHCAKQEEIFQEEEEQVHRLFLRIRETYAELGESVETEEDVQRAAGRAVSRYQEYRDAKRRLAESRDRPTQLQAQYEQTKGELEACRKEEVERSLGVRRTMREAGFREEARYTSALSALRAYRIRTAQLRQKRGRIDVLRERSEAVDRRLEIEVKDLALQEEALARLLSAGGVETVEQWHELAAKAKAFREARDERARLEEQMESLLRGERIETLRERVAEDGASPARPERGAAELKAELKTLVEEIETLSKQDHALHIAVTQRAAGSRSLNEIEEELAGTESRVAELEMEMEAASYAAALIEEVARDRHARIAPAMASLAGSYLEEITSGAYSELLISRELRITIRVPQTEDLNDDPERRLSKGTVDQIYLALRLALVRSLSESGESIPLLLDDPFANYDDTRLANAMALLQRIGATNQVLLFTCREDVAQTARAKDIPVLTL